MKRIFMCVNYPIDNPAIGISKKIKTQIEAFEELGYEVTYTAYTGNRISIFRNDQLLESYSSNSIIKERLFSALRSFLLLDATVSFLKKEQRIYDLGFIRWNALTKKYVDTVEQMDLWCRKVIMDCHGYHPQYSPETIKGKYIQFFTNLNSNKMSKYIDLCLLEAKGESVWGIRALPIDTGIDVRKYDPHEYRGRLDELRMISVANEQPYHGYDRIIRGIANYHGERPAHLHLVGKMSKRTIALVTELHLEESVTLHGYKTGRDLQSIYEDSNMGVGPLAPHRVGGKQGTGIKTKEYFAIGLPYFYAGQELLVPKDYPYVMRLASDESAIDIKSVFDFYDGIKLDVDIQKKMRDFARKNFSWPTIFSKAENILNS